MKKLMIAAAIVCAAAFAQAANIKWSVSGVTPSPAETAGKNITGYYVYGFVTDGAGTDTVTFTKEQAISMLLNGETIYGALNAAYGDDATSGYVAVDGSYTGVSTKGIDATGASGTNPITMKTAALIVAYDDSYGVADYQFVEGTVEFESTTTTPTTTLTASADNWNSVPEPTSGLLLLLGVAGLALKRKRA